MIQTLLIDVEGTLIENGGAVAGAPEAISKLKRTGKQVRLLTNISSRAPEVVADELCNLGFEDITARDIRTSATAAVQFLQSECASFTDILLPRGVQHLFGDLKLDRIQPDYVVVGDVGEGFSYQTLNAALGLLLNGARLLALQRNLRWQSPTGHALDAGAYIAALEAASGQSAILSGKPSSVFFAGALAEFGGKAATTLVVGDDQATDIQGACAIGARSAMVQTGKGRLPRSHLPQADFVVDSIAEIPDLLIAIDQRLP
ncbi:HAD hydrolase-like protein [Rhizobium sp. BK251]|uniref:HAD hydrolase-like protein n=1 Tax=Rhizobium sp. BK251 TaxID=2512125 RepID=UPI001046DFD5|nr:HAD hydrolase-like protein [Rhizobium sp. BK251]TCL65718.1 HAD superfamily hydrolase (TIGR01458 family) [Rhizobium sp. BK251]